ncbi:MAG: sigma-70 family RNA polymerase sigma factor [Acutalibacteraceae bacterium]
MNKDFIKIIPSALKGDNSAFEALYNITKDKAYFIALSLTHNENDAMDILQESYMKAFSNLDKVNPPEMFDNWFNRIVANQSKDFMKKKKPVLFDDISSDITVDWDESEKNEDYIPEQSLDNNETSRLIMEIINKLPEDQRLCILMYYYQDMSVADISSTLNLTVSTVKYKLSAARKTIKSEVEKLEKKGTKLYAVFPFALLPSIISQSAQATSAPAFSAVSSAVSGTVGKVATGTVANSTANMASKTLSGGINMIFKTTASKIIAAVLAVAVVGGGVTTAVIIANNNNKNSTPTSPAASSSVNVSSTGEESSGSVSLLESSDVSQNVDVEIIDENKYTYSDPYLFNAILSSSTESGSYDSVAILGCGLSDSTIVIPKEIDHRPVRKIMYKAFDNHENLTTLVIPDTVNTIGVICNNCPNLSEVIIPESVNRIDDGTFTNCPNLTLKVKAGSYAEQYAKQNNIPYTIYEMRKQESSVEESVANEISEKDFDTETAGNGVIMVKSYHGKDEEVIIPEEISGKKVISVASRTFENNDKITSVIIPDNIQFIGTSAFSHCTSLKNVTLSNSIDEISTCTFINCEALESIKIPDSVIAIGNGAFSFCTSLKSIEIPNSVTKIHECAFIGCDSLTIHGTKGSYAESFAKEQNIKFVAE